MTSFEVARAFRRDRELRCTYLIALSGYSQPEDIERASSAGFSRHLAKPASIDAVARLIAEARDSRRTSVAALERGSDFHAAAALRLPAQRAAKGAPHVIRDGSRT
jgi:CheY-like chemotaxis protein